MTDKITAATNKVAKAITDLAKAFETDAGSISEEGFRKVFDFLRVTVSGAEEKARIARILAPATTGTFSLDMELPTAPSPAPLTFPPGVRAPAGERLVGGQRVAPQPDLGVDFIDED